MPSSLRSSNSRTDSDTPDHLRPYTFHGMDLSVHGGQATGDCLFCGAAKFTVHVETGLWRCWVCGGGLESGGGNPLTFLRTLHAFAFASNPVGFAQEVASDRRLCGTSTAMAWGVCRSPLPPNNWLVPGYGVDGALDQLYKRTKIMDGNGEWKWLLLPTPGVWPEGKAHALHLPTGDYDPQRPLTYVCEGPWDGMALWEVAVTYPGWPTSNIISVPGCNVWRDEWTNTLKGKQVVLLFDNDHPRYQGLHEAKAGWDGMRRVARKLGGYASSVKVLQWGPDGYDHERPDGWDVRDHLSGKAHRRPIVIEERREALSELVSLVKDAPDDWSVPHVHPNGNGRAHMTEARPCHEWVKCLASWQEAMRWRQDMSDALLVMLAVCASTQQAGNQLFVDVVGSAGSGKTTMCEGLLVSNHCHHLEHLTGFHSGFKKQGEKDKDCSLIARINGKTLITPEFDILRTSPRYAELMGQTRRIFDGKSAATYKNSDEDTLYSGLRTPWIRAGTHAIMDTDQSQLGDRFLRIIIPDPQQDEKRAILRSAFRAEGAAMMEQSNGTAGSIVDAKQRLAFALTGGYVDWLRANVENKLPMIHMSDDIEDKCIDLAELCADLRSRPNEDKRRKDPHDGTELPTRLTRQSRRLAQHLAVVLNLTTASDEVMRIVRKVALDTAHGHSLNIVRWLFSYNPRTDSRTYQECGGLSTTTLEGWMGIQKERAMNYLLFLRKIGVLRLDMQVQTAGVWTVTDRVQELYIRTMRW